MVVAHHCSGSPASMWWQDIKETIQNNKIQSTYCCSTLSERVEDGTRGECSTQANMRFKSLKETSIEPRGKSVAETQVNLGKKFDQLSKRRIIVVMVWIM